VSTDNSSRRPSKSPNDDDKSTSPSVSARPTRIHTFPNEAAFPSFNTLNALVNHLQTQFNTHTYILPLSPWHYIFLNPFHTQAQDDFKHNHILEELPEDTHSPVNSVQKLIHWDPFKQVSPEFAELIDRLSRDCFDSRENRTVFVMGKTGSGKSSFIRKLTQSLVSPHCGTAKLEAFQKILTIFTSHKSMASTHSSQLSCSWQIHLLSSQASRSESKSENAPGKSKELRLRLNFLSFDSNQLTRTPLANESNFFALYLLLFVEKDFTGIQSSNIFRILGDNPFDSQQLVELGTDLLDAFNVVGIPVPFQKNIWSILLAILYLGNLTFAPADNVMEGDDLAKIPLTQRAFVDNAAHHLGISTHVLENFLTTKRVVSKAQSGSSFESKERTKESFGLTLPLNGSEATSRRNLLMRRLYGTVIDWFVEQFNKSLGGRSHQHLEKFPGINIVELSGYRTKNRDVGGSIEDLWINYTHECMRDLMHSITTRQGSIKAVLDGVLDDEEGGIFNVYPKAEDLDQLYLLSGDTLRRSLKVSVKISTDSEHILPRIRLLSSHSSSSKFGLMRSVSVHRSSSNWSFSIRHFFGDVNYNPSSFVETASHEHDADLFKLCINSSKSLLLSIPRLSRHTVNSSSIKKLITLSIQQCPVFVQCISPNENGLRHSFEYANVSKQLRSMMWESLLRSGKLCWSNCFSCVQFARAVAVKLRQKITLDFDSGYVLFISQSVTRGFLEFVGAKFHMADDTFSLSFFSDKYYEHTSLVLSILNSSKEAWKSVTLIALEKRIRKSVAKRRLRNLALQTKVVFKIRKFIISSKRVLRLQRTVNIVVIQCRTFGDSLKRLRRSRHVVAVQAFMRTILERLHLQKLQKSAKRIQTWYKHQKQRKANVDQRLYDNFQRQIQLDTRQIGPFLTYSLNREELVGETLDFRSILNWLNAFLDLDNLLRADNFHVHLANGVVCICFL
jgi:hypothetical protein